MCFYVSPEDLQNAWIVGYATPTQHNELLVVIGDETKLYVTIHNIGVTDGVEGFVFEFGKRVCG